MELVKFHDKVYKYNCITKHYLDGSVKLKMFKYDLFSGINKVSSRIKENVDYEKIKRHYKHNNMLRTKANIIDLSYQNSLDSPWEYFVTLTFNPKKVNSFDYDEVVSFMSHWLNNMKHKYKNMKYLIVPELHPSSGRIHFHGIFKGADFNLTPAINAKTGELYVENGKQIYNMDEYKYGYSTASRVENMEAVSVYMSKYISKELIDIPNKRRYWASKSLIRPVKEYAVFDEDTKQFFINCFEEQKDLYENDKLFAVSLHNIYYAKLDVWK